MMNRVYQQNINKPTEELTAEVLKSLMEQPRNQELIDAYRQLKREMAEAEARGTVEEWVKEVVASEDYKKWLTSELKKDERRKRKLVPADDLKRVKLYIAQKKSALPAAIPTVTHFAESKDRWGRTGLWRIQANGISLLSWFQFHSPLAHILPKLLNTSPPVKPSTLPK